MNQYNTDTDNRVLLVDTTVIEYTIMNYIIIIIIIDICIYVYLLKRKYTHNISKVMQAYICSLFTFWIFNTDISRELYCTLQCNIMLLRYIPFMFSKPFFIKKIDFSSSSSLSTIGAFIFPSHLHETHISFVTMKDKDKDNCRDQHRVTLIHHLQRVLQSQFWSLAARSLTKKVNCHCLFVLPLP